MKTKKESTNTEIETGKQANPVFPETSDAEIHLQQNEKSEPLSDDYVSELITSQKTSWNFIIPKKNVLIILALALASWGIVGLISLLIYRLYW